MMIMSWKLLLQYDIRYIRIQRIAFILEGVFVEKILTKNKFSTNRKQINKLHPKKF